MSSIPETLNSKQAQNWGRNPELLEPAALPKGPAEPSASPGPRGWSRKGLEWVWNYPELEALGLLGGFWIQDQHFHILQVLPWVPMAAAGWSLYSLADLTAPGRALKQEMCLDHTRGFPNLVRAFAQAPPLCFHLFSFIFVDVSPW